MEEFIGINIRRDMPVEKMQCVGFVREYHRAALDQGFPALNETQETASPVYPLTQYKFNPSYQTQAAIPFDTYYQDLTDSGLQIGVSLFQSFPWMWDSETEPLTPQLPEGNNILEQKPMYPGNDPLDPESYLAHADWMYHYAARYGDTAFSPVKTSQIIVPRLHPTEVPETGLGYINYFENWNEPDKWWLPHLPSTYFTPAEYAVMLSADADGHQGTMGLVPDPDNPGEMISAVGIKNADPTAKVVATGLSDFDLAYIEEMTDWFAANRTAAGLNGQYPFDVISYHHYSNTGQELNQLGLYGISPEEDLIKEKMQPLVTHRDTHFPDAELWLSEFGYDVDSLSPQRVPWEGIGGADREEVQAQWIVRSYLETAAAGFDRAMLYELRDACEGDLCGLFQVSGLTERDYAPRKSWYYVYTMKNVLTGYVYDGELSPCQMTDCDTDCPRVYRFVRQDNPAEKVFALWSPTSCDKPAYSYALDLEGGNAATLIEMHVPSTIGTETALSGAVVNVPITERPVFVRTGSGQNSPVVNCLSALQMSESTCSSARVAWSAAAGQEEVDIWLFPAGTTDFDIFEGEFVAENVPASAGDYNITGLAADTEYEVALFARDAAGNVSAACPVTVSTGSATCKIEIDPAWIYDYSGVTQTPAELFDEQAAHDPICGDGGTPATFFGFSAGNPQDISVSVDLQAYYHLDALYLFDTQDYSTFTVEYAETPNGPWQLLTEYLTIPFDEWVTLDNLLPSDTPVRYLRFTSDGDDRALIGEVILCGRESDFDDSDLPPSAPIDFVHTGSSCNSLRFAWTAPLETDIIGYQISYNGQTVTVPAAAGEIAYELFNLTTQTAYDITCRTVDADDNLSAAVTLTASTLTDAECDTDCDNTCACRICLQPAWIQNLTPASGIDPGRLADEQDTNPICGAGTFALTEWGENYDLNSPVPPMIAVVDLQQCYALSSVYVFDGSGQDILLAEYLDDNNEWQLFAEYLTAKNFEWHEFTDLGITTRYLRLTKTGNQAKINEIAVCGTPSVCGECTFTPGTPCDDGNDCTESDVYDADCQCSGIFADADNDAVCDADDICAGFDDNADNDNDGIPNGCDDTPDGDENEDDCDYLQVTALVTDAGCAGSTDGAIQLEIPDCPGGSSGGGTPVNLALTGTPSQISTGYSAPADRATDGNTDGNFWGTQTCSATTWAIQPWWEIDLGAVSDISAVNIWNRTDCCAFDLNAYYILVSETPFASDNLDVLLLQSNVTSFLQEEAAGTPSTVDINTSGRYVRIQKQGIGFLIMAEVEVMGTSSTGNGCTYDLTWSDGLPAADHVTDLSVGSYQVTVTGSDGCSDNLNITVGNAGNDTDNDGVCDADDICAGFDDNEDNDNDGIPNGCDDTPDGGGTGTECVWDLTAAVTDESCNGANDGTISLTLPCTNSGNTGGGSVGENLALNGTATQSGTNWEAEASRANDGNTDGNFWGSLSVTGTAWRVQPWWQIDLGQVSAIQSVNVWNRTDCCASNLTDYYVLISDNPITDDNLFNLLNDADITALLQTEQAGSPTVVPTTISGRYVRIQILGTGILSLAEVEIIGGSGGGEDCDLTVMWSDGLNPDTEQINLPPGIYTVSVTDNIENCTDVENFTVAAAAEDCSGITLNCPADIEVEAPTGSTTAVVTWDAPSAAGTCAAGGVIVTQTAGMPSGSAFAVGSTEVVTYTATDDCGNTAECSFTVRTDGEVVVGGPAPENYCSAQGDEPWWQWISRVTFAEIDHESGKDVYGDFTHIETPVTLGSTYEITLQPDFSWLPYDEYRRVWIDFNRDGDFADEGETVLEDHGTGIITGDISIPTTASLGKTRMRIAMQNGAYAEPCGSFQYGEVEDYIVDIQTEPGGFRQGAFFTFSAEKAERAVRLHWATNTASRTANFVLERSTDGISFTEIHHRSVTPDGYRQVFDYTDGTLTYGTYYYRLRREMRSGAVHYSEVRRVDFAIDLAAVQVFPNPTVRIIKTALRAYLGRSVRLQLINQYGQVLEEKRYENLEEELPEFDMREYPDGLYFITVQSEGVRLVSRRFLLNKL